MVYQNGLSNGQDYKIKEERNVFKYTLTVGVVIVAAIAAGILTNKLVNFISNKFRLNNYAKLLVQVIIIALVLFSGKRIAHYIDQEPDNNYSYDVIFIAVYMTSQQNFQDLLRRYE